MIAIPAIDLRDGACVQLVGGSFDKERVRIADPRRALDQWEFAGFQRVHIVDLDAAVGDSHGDNSGVIDDLLSATSIAAQVGGGVRSSERVDELFGAGATQVIVGTRAIEDPTWLESVASRYPGRIIVAADVRQRQIVTHGWATTLSLDITDAVERLNAFVLGGILVTAVHVEGRMSGPDLKLVEMVADRAAFPVIASGGIASIKHLRSLDFAGAAASVIGMALYTGTLNARAVAEEFSE
jgi:phosphoribosylformimino-5-aminoimidazole carboxamide ribotide isomerase